MRRAVLGALLGGLFALGAAPSYAASTPLPDSKSKPDSIMFAGIPWLTPADGVAHKLAAHGFTETRDARTKEMLAATGTLFERFALIHARLDDHGRLVRWEITLPSKGERDEYDIQRKIYDDAVTEMIQKYGRRKEQTEWYHFPYAKGDGKEARGIREGLVKLYSAWGSRKGDQVAVAIVDDMSVTLTYESRYWKKVEDERRKKKAKDL